MNTHIDLTILDNIRIAAPCSARWEEMTGTERARHCAECDKNVYNISAMTRQEATEFITNATGRVCVRLYRRSDGTVITQDCPTGVRTRRRARLRRTVAAAAVVIATGAAGLRGASGGDTEEPLVMGEMMMVDPEPADTTKQGTSAQDSTVLVDTLDDEPMMTMGMMVAPDDEHRIVNSRFLDEDDGTLDDEAEDDATEPRISDGATENGATEDGADLR